MADSPAPPCHWPAPFLAADGSDRRAFASALDIDEVRELLGMLLVNGSFKVYPTPSGGYVQLSLVAGLAAGDLLDAKAQLLRRHLPTRAAVQPTLVNRNGGRATAQLRLRVSSNRLRPIYNLLYPGGEREITRNALDLLGAKAAGWLWADGARWLPDGAMALRHVGATRYEACLIGGWLEVLTGAASALDDRAARPKLLLERDQALKAAEVLRPFAPQCRLQLFAEPES